MPELPEVETFRRQLAPLLQGQTIKRLHVEDSGLRMIFPADAQQFQDLLMGKQISSLDRKGKFLILQLDRELTILIHLRMSGRLIFSESFYEHKHKRLELEFMSGARLNFIDIRRFGTFHLSETEGAKLNKLGPDLLTGQEDIKELFKKARKRNIVVHKLLLDQSFLAGAGNIYANEALFNSGISPLRSSNKLKLKELENLLKNLKNIIRKAVEFKGTTLIDKSYRDSLNENGEFSKMLQVYGRKNEKCFNCAHKLDHKRLGGRSVFFCSNCQK